MKIPLFRHSQNAIAASNKLKFDKVSIRLSRFENKIMVFNNLDCEALVQRNAIEITEGAKSNSNYTQNVTIVLTKVTPELSSKIRSQGSSYR